MVVNSFLVGEKILSWILFFCWVLYDLLMRDQLRILLVALLGICAWELWREGNKFSVWAYILHSL